MINSLNFFLILIGLMLLVPVLVIFIQTVAAILLKNKILLNGQRKSIAVLVPAHNEEGGILDTLLYLKPQLEPCDRLIVIADNCTDQTASVAQSVGVEVIERTNPNKRGKGYALDFGLQYLLKKPPEFVIVVDADCKSSSNLLDRLAKVCSYYGRPIQALYLMHASKTSGLKLKVAAFAWIFKNKVRALGFSNLGLPCQLMGTGMAFLWNDISQANLASDELVEDLKLGLEFSKNMLSPLFCSDVLVESYFPDNETGIKSQRTRWEHGHLSMIVKTAPGYFIDVIKQRNFNLMFLLLDMVVPPLALLAMLIFAYLILVMGGYYFFGQLVPLLTANLILFMFLSAIFMGWIKFARHIISFIGLIYVPFYVCLKIPLYIKFLVNKQVEWVRSNRDNT